jgi:hypothetical protein
MVPEAGGQVIDWGDDETSGGGGGGSSNPGVENVRWGVVYFIDGVQFVGTSLCCEPESVAACCVKSSRISVRDPRLPTIRADQILSDRLDVADLQIQCFPIGRCP